MNRVAMPAGLILLWCQALVVAHETGDSPAVAGFDRFFADHPPSVAAGDLLLSELSCTACHTVDAKRTDLAPKRGPVLDGLGSRRSPKWLRKFLENPTSVKPGATMPNLFAGTGAKTRQDRIDALVHFLMSDASPFWPEIEVKDSDDPAASSYQRGFQLFHQVGCVACHEPDPKHSAYIPMTGLSNDPQDDDDDGLAASLDRSAHGLAPSIPLGPLAAKYDHETLISFLLDPLKARPSGRMPDMKLGMLEAADLAHYLLGGRPQPDPADSATDPAKVVVGRGLFQTLGCASCHALNEILPGPVSTSLPDLPANSRAGCISPEPGGAVQYPLSAIQRRALQLAIASARPQPAPTPAQIVDHVMMRMNCYGCHERQTGEQAARGGVGNRRWDFFETAGSVDFGDEGRIPPSLNGVGRKLTRSALNQVLDGQGDVRQHMLVRMPKFGMHNVASLTGAFIQSDDTDDVSPIAPAGDAEAGRRLMDHGCVQCHPVNGQRMTGVVGVDLTDLEKRLQPAWFQTFLLNPEAVKPRTRMPTLFNNGRSVVPDILDGDPDRQIAALWAYLKSTADGVLPDKLVSADAQNFELIPRDEPILLRTFMRDAGTHAVAVGFPENVHFAFDAEQVRLAMAWKGRFLDAHGTWFDRVTPPAEPLGHSVIHLPPGPPLARLSTTQAAWPPDDAAGYRWRGFRLDKQGRPTFLYRFRELEVAERIVPLPDARGLKRTLDLTGNADGVWFRASGSGQPKNETSVVVRRPVGRAVVAGHELRVPVVARQGRAMIEVEYRW